jgi:hypothetical protein
MNNPNKGKGKNQELQEWLTLSQTPPTPTNQASHYIWANIIQRAITNQVHQIEDTAFGAIIKNNTHLVDNSNKALSSCIYEQTDKSYSQINFIKDKWYITEPKKISCNINWCLKQK